MKEQHLVIGTAGHIDHGKTSIVKAITGIDPTRLQEEKRRAITIDLGFSYFKVDNKTVGIIDLPGHEKFISNMIVGSSNIDMILFIIAADDGIMPQTIEHFEIISLLKIKHAIIVLSKADLVSDELLNQRKEEIQDFFKNTPFETSKIVSTSIINENSIIQLKDTLTSYIKNNDFIQPEFDIFRMAIDRSFSIQGIGTIVTGTSQGKELFKDETLELYPSNHKVKIKNIQNHNVDVNSIASGQRAALQLSKISKDEIVRGDIIATENSLKATRCLDVMLDVLKSSKPIKNNQTIRIFHQTKEIIGKVKLNTKTIKPNSKGYATIVLKNDIYAIKGDLAIVRFFSPIKTIAGFEILDMLDEVPKLDNDYYLKYLDNNLTQQIINYLKKENYANQQQILSIFPKKDELSQSLNQLVTSNIITTFIYNQKVVYLLKDLFDEIQSTLVNTLTTYHQANPLVLGQSIQSVHQANFNYLDIKVFKALIKEINKIKINKDIIALSNFKIQYTPQQKLRKNNIMTSIKQSGYNLYSFETLYEKFNEEQDKIIVQALLNEKVLLIINNTYLISDRMYNQAVNYLKTPNNKIELSVFKAQLDCSRKYCIALLEHFDNNKITQRIDDYRILIKC